jgi:predicted ester cyclase
MKVSTGYLPILLVAVVLILLIPAVSVAGEGMEAAVHAYVKAWNTGELDSLGKVLDENVARHVCGETTANNLAELKQLITDFRADYPDFVVTIKDIFVAGDKCACRWVFKGTEKGTAKVISATGLSISHWKDGKMVEEWAEYDKAAVQEQLGYTVTPPAGLKAEPAE